MQLSPRIFLLAMIAVCCLTTYSVAAPVVLFDESHSQQFVIGKSGPLDLSGLAALYRANGFTVLSHSDGLSNNPLNFKVSIMAEHPVTAGLESFSIYGAWALRGTAPHSMVLAETSQHGWVDLNHDNQLAKGDVVQTFGVMVAGKIGKGRYVVLGDDAVFQNHFLDGPNRQLALRLINWLGFQ